MSAAERPQRTPAAPWSGIARVWGLLAAVGFLSATVGILVQILGLFSGAPEYIDGGDQIGSEARYFAELFAYNQSTSTINLVVVLGFSVAFVSLVPLYLAAVALTGGRSPAAGLTLAFAVLAAALVVVYAALSSVPPSFWGPGWDEVAPEVTVAVGRDLSLLQNVAQEMLNGVLAMTALSLAHLSWACRSEPELPSGLAAVSAVGAIALGIIIGLNIVGFDNEAVNGLLTGITGGIIAPVVSAGLALRLGRTG